MATAPYRTCLVRGCPVRFPSSEGGRCPAHRKSHQKAADAARGTAQQRGYDSKWATFAAAWRLQYPVCGMRSDGRLHAEHSSCVKRGLRTTTDLVADHIVPLAQGGGKYDDANVQTLCRSCNTAKDCYGHGTRTAR